MNIRTQTSKAIGEMRVRRETQDCAVFSVYRTALADHFAPSGSLAWNIRELLRTQVAADRREETLFMPPKERSEMLAVCRKFLAEVAE